jgi:hypothetical protein
MITHKKGEFIGLSGGEYSDYSFNGLYRALADFDLGDAARRYYDQCPVCEWDTDRNEASESGFGAWMIVNGMVEEIDYDEVHCGSYSMFEVDEIAASAAKRASAS